MRSVKGGIVMRKAVMAATNKAQDLAALAGIELGEVISISEVIGGPSPLVGFRADAAGMGGGAPPISPGQLEVTTRLEVVYRIQSTSAGPAGG
jgi:uncharacterized protein YggE